MKRSNKNKLRVIGVLMLVSQLVLVLFVGRWVTSQYTEEKATLSKQLDQLIRSQYDKMIDSVVQSNIPPSVINKMNGHRHSVSENIQIVKRPTQSAIVNIDDTVGPSVTNEPLSFMYDDTSMLKRGVRSFVVRLSEDISSLPLLLIDSIALRKGFEKTVSKEGILVSISWDKKTASKDAIVLRSTTTINTSTSTNTAYITSYKPFLFKKISPQIGFSALLIILCGAAFILSYNTARRQLKLNAQKDSFISNMSHELKTPVATAKVAIEALRKYDGINDPVKTRDYLQMAAWEIDRLEALIGNVLNNVQLEEGRMTMQKTELDFSHMVGEMIAGMQPLFTEKAKNVSFHISIAEGRVNGDRIHLQGAVYNVLDNAIKYGGTDINIHLKKQDGHIIISIADDGPGVPEEYKRKIFEKFFRIPSGNVHNVKGYGLGLNYTRFVVKAHGGSIHQENNEWGGATFIISIPALPA